LAEFEEAGLKIDKDRVLTYSQLSCPLDCTYCFVDEMDTNQKKKVAYLSDKQFGLLKELPEEVKLIMLGCDTEFFQQREASLKTLEHLAELGKDISVITKLYLSKEFIAKVAKIDKQMSLSGKRIAFSISVPCGSSFRRWEPKAPSPEKRIESLRYAHEEGLLTMVAIRPLIPTVSNEELKDIIDKTIDISQGYYSGPLYLKNPDKGLLTKEELSTLKAEKMQPHWMLDGNIYYRLERPGQMDYLKSLLDDKSKPMFEGAAEGIDELKKKSHP